MAAPTIWGNLLPAGLAIKARDGRSWTYDPAEVIAAFRADPQPLPLDYEHAQDLVAPTGGAAPAAGWIVDLAERDALCGRLSN